MRKFFEFFKKDAISLFFSEKIFLLSAIMIIILLFFFKMLFHENIKSQVLISVFWMSYLLVLPILFSELTRTEYENNTIYLWIKNPSVVYFFSGKIIAGSVVSLILFFAVFFFWYLFFEYEILNLLNEQNTELGKLFFTFFKKALWITALTSILAPFIYYLSYQTSRPYLIGKILLFLNSLWILMLLF